MTVWISWNFNKEMSNITNPLTYSSHFPIFSLPLLENILSAGNSKKVIEDWKEELKIKLLCFSFIKWIQFLNTILQFVYHFIYFKFILNSWPLPNMPWKVFVSAVWVSAETLQQADSRVHIWHCPQYCVCVFWRLVHFVSQLSGFRKFFIFLFGFYINVLVSGNFWIIFIEWFVISGFSSKQHLFEEFEFLLSDSSKYW